MSIVKVWFIAVLMLFSQLGFAAESNVLTKADIKIELIQDMKKDGYLSDKMATEVSGKYITEEDKKPLEETVVTKGSSIQWQDWLSWTNFGKVLGTILILIAFSGVLKKIIKGMWKFIVAVPPIVYQTGFIGLFGVGLIRPDLIWASQAFYIALFSSFAFIMVLAWIAEAYPSVLAVIKKCLTLVFRLRV